MRLVNWWRALGALPTRESAAVWSWWRWQMFYAAYGFVGRIAVGSRRGTEYPRPAWWLFPLMCWDMDGLAVVTSRRWWWALWWRVAGRPCRIAVRLGVWELAPGLYFSGGHLCRRPWENPRSVWVVRRKYNFPRKRALRYALGCIVP